MPTKYDPDTGIPYWMPDLGEELTEGVTPKPDVITSKADVFKGDKKPTKAEYEQMRDGDQPDVQPIDPGPYIHPDDSGQLWSGAEVYKMIENVSKKYGKLVTPEQYEKLKAEIEGIGGKLNAKKSAKLARHIATDEELNEIERMANAHEVSYWPMLLRLINRLRQAEGQ